MSSLRLSIPSRSPLNSPSPSSSKRFNFKAGTFEASGSVPYIFLQAKKNRTDTILTASIELRKRGFVVEVEQEAKNGSCHFLLSLSPTFIQKLALSKNYEIRRQLSAYSSLQQLILLNTAIDVLTDSCTFLEGRSAWVAHDPKQFEPLLKEKNLTKKLTMINSYFGPQIGLYFGWLYHYTGLLMYPSLFGLFTFAHQYYYNEVDSTWMPFYAVFISIWTTIFLELSKRNCASLAFQFEVLGQEEEKEISNKHNELSASAKKENGNSPFRLLLSFSAIMVLMYFMIEIMLFAVHKQIHAEEIYGKESYWKYFPSILYSVIPIIASSIFQPVAEYLTNFEAHLTQEEYERYFVLKQFALQFVNRYCGLLYIAFYLRDLNLLRSLLVSLLVNGAIINNFMELGIPYLTSWYNHLVRRKKLSANSGSNSAPSTPRAPVNTNVTSPNSASGGSMKALFLEVDERERTLEQKFEIIENELSISDYDLNDDYMEMAIQFGYLSMFAVVFPLTPLLAYVNNLFEPMVDLTKLSVCKRYKVQLRSNIGAWQTCFEFISVVAVITNCYLLAMISTKLQVLVPSRFSASLALETEFGRVLAMLFFEHVLLGFKIVLMSVIDDVPRHVREAISRIQADKGEAHVEQRVEMFTHLQKAKAYDSLVQTARLDPNADIVPLKEAVLAADRRIAPSLLIADQLCSIERVGSNGHDAATSNLHALKSSDAKAKLMHLFERDSIGFHPLTLLSVVFVPYLCQYFQLPALLYIPIAIVVLTYYQSQKNRIDRQIALGIVTDFHLLKLIEKEMPSWFQDSDFHRVEWLNTALTKLFPQIAHAVEVIVKEKVQPSIDQNTPFYLPQLEIVHAKLGSVSPKITGTRVFHNHESNIRLDVELKWASDVQVTLKLHTPPLPIIVELTDLCATANVRVEFLELSSRLPCFRALSITCMKKPKIDFSLKLASLDVMNVGAADYNITSMVQTIIESAIAGSCLYPKKILIPMDKEVNLDDLLNETPDGILIVHLIRGVDLLAVNFTGGSDPFVEFISSHDSGNPVRSTVKYGTVQPEWNETFTFFIHDKNTETINVTVYDSDITNQMPTPLGNAVIHLDLIKRNLKTPEEVNLPLRDVSRGSLRFACIYKPIKKAKSSVTTNADGDIIDDNVLYTELDDEDLGNNDKLLQEGEDSNEDLDGNELRDTGFPTTPSPLSLQCRAPSQSSDFSSGRVHRRLSMTSADLSKKKMEEFHKSLELMVGILNISHLQLKDIKLPDGYLTTTTLRLYVTLTLGSKVLSTKYIKNNQNPTFTESFTFLINSMNEELLVNVYNKTKYSLSSSSKPIGSVIIPLHALWKGDDEEGTTGAKRGIIQRIEQEYMLNGLKDEGYVRLKAILSLFEH